MDYVLLLDYIQDTIFGVEKMEDKIAEDCLDAFQEVVLADKKIRITKRIKNGNRNKEGYK